MARNLKCAPVGRGSRLDEAFPLVYRGVESRRPRFEIGVVQRAGIQDRRNAAQVDSRPDDFRIQIVDFVIAPIADNELVLAIIHRQTLAEVFESVLELPVLLALHGFAQLERLARLFAVRDIIVDHNPSTLGAQIARHLQYSPVRQGSRLRKALALVYRRIELCRAFMEIDVLQLVGMQEPRDGAQVNSRPDDFRIQAIDFVITRIADHELVVVIVHRQALAQAFERVLEPLVLRGQFGAMSIVLSDDPADGESRRRKAGNQNYRRRVDSVGLIEHEHCRHGYR